MINLDRKAVKNFVSVVSPLNLNRVKLPVLENVMVTNDSIRATNLDVDIQARFFPGKRTEAAFLVPYKVLKKAAEDKTGTDLIIRNGEVATSFSYPFNKTDIDLYPSIAERVYEKLLAVPVTDLAEAWDAVKHAIGKDLTRPHFTYALLKCREGKVWLVATDTYKLVEVEVAAIPERDLNLLIPPAALEVFARVVKNYRITGTAHVDVSADGRVLISAGSNPRVEIRAKTGEGKWPDYRTAIPSPGAMQVWINVTPELVKAVENAAKSTKDSFGMLGVYAAHGKTTLVLQGNGEPYRFAELETGGEGKGCQFTRAKHLVDVLKTLVKKEGMLGMGPHPNPILGLARGVRLIVVSHKADPAFHKAAGYTQEEVA